MTIDYRAGGDAVRNAFFAFKEAYIGAGTPSVVSFVAGWNAAKADVVVDVVPSSIRPTAAEMAEVVLTTTNGYPYSRREACQLAYGVWVRFGRDDVAATQAWCRLLENDTPVVEFKQLVDAYLYTYLKERTAENGGSSH